MLARRSCQDREIPGSLTRRCIVIRLTISPVRRENTETSYTLRLVVGAIFFLIIPTLFAPRCLIMRIYADACTARCDGFLGQAC